MFTMFYAEAICSHFSDAFSGAIILTVLAYIFISYVKSKLSRDTVSTLLYQRSTNDIQISRILP